MNKEIILSMVKPYVQDDAITYDEFDKLFSILARKEQYAVSELLYQNGINLVDRHIAEDTLVLDVNDGNASADSFESENFEFRYDDGLFKDKGIRERDDDNLIVHQEVRQSNEILCSLIQQGNRQAAQDLCVKNKGLVEKYAATYKKYYRNHLDIEDLEQIGFMGLLKAAQKFDIQQGYSFSTYATFWIKQYIAREIMDNGYAIHIPVHMMERINKVSAEDNRLEGQEERLFERIPHIAEELGLEENEVRECLVLKNNYLSYVSLDTPVGDDQEALLGDFIPIEEELSVEQITVHNALRKELESILSTISPRERDVIKLRFGLDDGSPKTLEEIGSKYNVTRERIRQIEEKALRRIRSQRRSRRLLDFWEA